MKYLHACPFCRHTPTGISYLAPQVHRAVCICGACGPLAETQDAASDKWNASDRSSLAIIETPLDLLKALHSCCQAAKTIRLPGMPESDAAMNAQAIVDEISATLQLNQMEASYVEGGH